MNEAKRGPGRPRLPDAGEAATSIRAAMLPQELLEAKRRYDRMRQRRLRETRRRNRNNPQGLKPGVDGLRLLQEENAVAQQPAPEPQSTPPDQSDDLPINRMLAELARAKGLI
jgi:hypothetical protein